MNLDAIDPTGEHKNVYLVCLEDWPEEMKEAGDRKEKWYHKMTDKGLRVKFALDDRGRGGGMIQYRPVEHSFAQGRSNFQKIGLGKALLRAAEEDAGSRGTKGMAARSLSGKGLFGPDTSSG